MELPRVDRVNAPARRPDRPAERVDATEPQARIPAEQGANGGDRRRTPDRRKRFKRLPYDLEMRQLRDRRQSAGRLDVDA